MITAILPSFVVFAIVATYMTVVHRMLRADEHWRESDVDRSAAKPSAAAPQATVSRVAHA